VWNQALAMLMMLKIRNGFGEKELAAAVGTALRRGVKICPCEDCGWQVACGASNSGERGVGAVPLGWRFLNLAGTQICTQSPASLRNERE
jgi:hypothetical protein